MVPGSQPEQPARLVPTELGEGLEGAGYDLMVTFEMLVR